jgi:hypothetical protein
MDQPKDFKPPHPPKAPPKAAGDREAKLAAALRANLKRRKAAARDD